MEAEFRAKKSQAEARNDLAEAGLAQVEALRQELIAELQEYGGILATIEGVHEVMGPGTACPPSSGAALGNVSDLNARIQRASTTAGQRRGRQELLARSLRQPVDAPLEVLIPLLPAKYRPAINALVRENNEMRLRIARYARKNELSLAKSLAAMRGLGDESVLISSASGDPKD